jgi:serine/threonine-protein kinase RsbW
VSGAYPVLHVSSTGSRGFARPARPWARTYRGIPASVSEARRFVAEVLASCPAREVLVSCVSELCANAIAHTASGQGGSFSVAVDLPQDGVARIAVTDDGGPSLPAVRSLDLLDPMAVDLMAEGGRGLALVAACTSRWGYAEADPGLTVWAEACWPVSVPSPGHQSPRRLSGRPRDLEPPSSRLFPLPPDDDWPPGPAA